MGTFFAPQRLISEVFTKEIPFRLRRPVSQKQFFFLLHFECLEVRLGVGTGRREVQSTLRAIQVLIRNERCSHIIVVLETLAGTLIFINCFPILWFLHFSKFLPSQDKLFFFAQFISCSISIKNIPPCSAGY